MTGHTSQKGLKPKVLILGFGRLGGAFYQLFHSRYEIRGIKRSPGPDDPQTVKGMDIQSEAVIPLLQWADIVVFCPSSGGGNLGEYKETYLENIRFVIDLIQSHSIQVRHFSLIGSTGVYPRKQGDGWSEETLIPIESPRQEILISTENALVKSGFDYAILRCGGLYGQGRGNFGRILEAGKIFSSALTDQFYPLISQEDACGVINRLIESGCRGTYNLVDDSGLTRRQLYTWIAGEAGIPIEHDGDAPKLPERVIPNTKLKQELKYEFRSPRVTDYLINRLVRKK